MSSQPDNDSFRALLSTELVASIDAQAPKPGLRDRILQTAAGMLRFERFVPQVARLLKLDEPSAHTVLAQLDAPAAWSPGLSPGMRLLHVLGGPDLSEHVAGFVQLPAGQVFPTHTHLGLERSLIIQGSLRELETGEILRAGDMCERAAGSSHSFEARPGPDLLYLVTIRDGVDIGDVQLRPPDR